MTEVLSRDEVYEHLESRLWRRDCEQGECVSTVITADYDALMWLKLVSCLSRHYEAESDQGMVKEMFDVRGVALSGAFSVVCPHQPFSSLLLQAIRYAPTYLKKHFPYHDYDPYVDLFLYALDQQAGLSERVKHGMNGLSRAQAETLRFQLNGFLFQLRSKARSTQFKKTIRRHKRAALKNYLSVKHYVRRLFSRHARLLVVRVDLYYPSGYQGTSLTGKTVTAKQASEDRAAFLQALKQSDLSTELLGYCWKLEFGLDKGFHYHCFFFFNGAKVRKDVLLGRLIGEVWARVIGHQNTYWNCNANKHRYSTPGIGMVSHNDQERLKGLDKAIAYLTKPDYFLCLAVDKVGRILGKGVLPPQKNQRGRPRSTRLARVS